MIDTLLLRPSLHLTTLRSTSLHFFLFKLHPTTLHYTSVGIAIRYGLHGPGIESRRGSRFSAPVQTDSEAHPASYTTGTGSFPGVKRPGYGADHSPPSSAEVKEKSRAIPLLPLWTFTTCCRVNCVPLSLWGCLCIHQKWPSKTKNTSGLAGAWCRGSTAIYAQS